MSKADLLRIDGIGEPTAAKLVADGVTTASELKTAPPIDTAYLFEHASDRSRGARPFNDRSVHRLTIYAPAAWLKPSIGDSYRRW